jgi:hypothetical protein
MNDTKQTHRGKGRKRAAPPQNESAPAHDRKRAARRRKASASEAPDVRTRPGQVELPPKAPEPKTLLQSKLDTLIGLLAETQPAAPAGIPPQPTAASSQSASPTVHDLHKEMLWCIMSLEVAMAALPSRRQGLDDDSSSEPIGPPPFSDSDRQTVANAIAVLKAQPPEPSEPPVEALEAAELLRAFETRRWDVAPPLQPDTFLPAPVKAAGPPLSLANRMGALANAAIHWINSLKPPF